MSDTYSHDLAKIIVESKGTDRYLKVSYPVIYGINSIIETKEYSYYFNLLGEIKYIKPLMKIWPGDEWLKRTAANKWVYYTPGIYTGIYSYIGEYYLPCFQYVSNTIFAYRPFENTEVYRAIESMNTLHEIINVILSELLPGKIDEFLRQVQKNTPEHLMKKSMNFQEILGNEISVLPPDARHVDYDVIPIIISDGCLYNCGFCMVKSGNAYKVRSRPDIEQGLRDIKKYYDRDLVNYNSIYLGLHDSLMAGEEIIIDTIRKASGMFGFEHSYIKGRNLFLFGSVESILNSSDSLYLLLNQTGYYVYINTGLESADDATLNLINKPLNSKVISDAFHKILELNRKYENIELTMNFIIGGNLTDSHYRSIIDLCDRHLPGKYGKSCMYLSPIAGNMNHGEMQNKFKEIKHSINIPAFLYLIQKM